MTKIIIHVDVLPNGAHIDHFIDADAVGFSGASNPTGLPDPITMVQYLKWLSTNPAMRGPAGWDLPGVIPGDATPLTRWQRLVAAVNQLPAAHPAKQAGLV